LPLAACWTDRAEGGVHGGGEARPRHSAPCRPRKGPLLSRVQLAHVAYGPHLDPTVPHRSCLCPRPSQPLPNRRRGSSPEHGVGCTRHLLDHAAPAPTRTCEPWTGLTCFLPIHAEAGPAAARRRDAARSLLGVALRHAADVGADHTGWSSDATGTQPGSEQHAGTVAAAACAA